LKNNGKFAVTAMVIISALVSQSVLAQNMTNIPVPSTNTQTSGQVSQNVTENPENASMNLFLSHSNPIGLVNAEDSINKVTALIQKNKTAEAKIIIEPLMEWLEDVTEYHTNLYRVLKEIDTAKVQADLERELALKSAILRDKAAYQLAILYIQEKNLKEAVNRLVDIVRSQPKTQLGFSAYQTLQQIGFTYKVQLTETEQEQTENTEIIK
jgi:hypothetical protein